MYDILGYVHPFMTVPHSGMKFSSPAFDNDILLITNCAELYGGAWWHIKCSLWCPTLVSPIWFSIGDSTWYTIKDVHIMVKPQ